MSMQIGQMMRNLLGEMQPAADAKSLELKVGQIVKGMVLQLLGEQDAIVNIGGVHMRAKLEIPLRQGLVTFLQVMPDSNGSQLVLKPVNGSALPLDEGALSELVKGFPSKDQPALKELAKQLQQADVPPTKANLQSFHKIMTQAPAQVPANQWLEAAVVANDRNLPLTRETVAGLREAMFGPALQERLDGLEARASEASRTLAASGTAAELKPLLDKLQQAIGQVREAAGRMPAAASAMPAALAAEQAAPDVPARPQTSAANPAPGTANATAREPIPWSQSAGAAPTAVPASGPGSGGAATGANGAGQAGDGRTPGTAAGTEAAVSRDSAIPKAANPAASAIPAAPQPSVEHDPSSSGRPAARADDNWISRVLKAVGMDHEHQLAKAIEKAEPKPGGTPMTHDPASVRLAAQEPEVRAVPSDPGRHAAADSLKSVLLQVISSSSAPEPLREQAQQTLQQITGQQLLLSPDRGSVFSHVTLLLPVRHEGSEQTAAIHVQSRKGKRGEIDAQNCRLLFDLNMQTLGLTLVDVQVFDKKVHLQVHNDMPFLGPLLQQYRDEIENGLRQNGYQFMALKCSPFPQPAQADSDSSGMAVLNPDRAAAASGFRVKPYKGVDVKV
ncbi:MAG: hypothetical protein K0Q94_208 [Paenibacillus sp.]|nr:hypothetical protein [Paenibacillus sp.]